MASNAAERGSGLDAARTETPSRERRLAFITVALALLLSLLGGEAALRFFFPQPVYSRFEEMVGSYYAPSDTNTFTLQRSYRGLEPSMEYPGTKVRVTTNALGFRGEEFTLEKPPGVKRIVVMGDSYTFGTFVADEDTYCARLQKRLRDLGYPVQVVNAGYADGWETDEQYAWLVTHGLRLQPDIVLYGFFLGNDIMGIDRSAWKETDEHGLPTRTRSARLFVDDRGRIRSRDEDYKTVGVERYYRIPVLRESHLFIAVVRAVRRIVGARRKVVVEDYPHIFGLRDPSFAAKEAAFFDLVQGMKRETERRAARFAVLMIPFNFMVEPSFGVRMFQIAPAEFRMVDYYARAEQTFTGLGISSLNLQRAMLAHPQEEFFPRNGEVHFNPRGHAFTAEIVADYLIRQGFLP
jgi:lysophospholipase L1-like esterase